jgi:manganese efflux pump family protein
MDFITISLVALGLTFDSLAVSISTGLVVSHIRFSMAFKIAFIFAVFQGLMPALGWLMGFQIKGFMDEYDHWIAFILLSAIGAKMIHESFSKENKIFDPTRNIIILGLAFATSIDAFVVGITFAFIEMNIILAVFVIGTLTFLVSMTGILIGKKARNLGSKKVELFGGLILIGIGIKILLEHFLDNISP